MYSSVILFALATIIAIHVGYSSSTTIRQIDGKIYCGSLVCPPNSVNCRVSTKNDPKNVYVLITKEICSDASGKILQQNSFETSNPSGSIVTSQSGVGPEYEGYAREQTIKAQQQAQKIQENIQNQINQAFQNFPFNFGPGFPFQK